MFGTLWLWGIFVSQKYSKNDMQTTARGSGTWVESDHS